VQGGAFGPPPAITPLVGKVDNCNVVNITVVNRDCGQSGLWSIGPCSQSQRGQYQRGQYHRGQYHRGQYHRGQYHRGQY